MARYFDHENKYSKTYATKANARKVIDKLNVDCTYIVVPTSEGRFQPIITAAGPNMAWFAHNGFVVTGV